ncbi:TRAP transporter small permease subunit [Phreatobacter cathodiphilus]|uniref:TRAP transporter small permease subunit n=1 Tax=Phreatobacter cathodiphilus TaxID=1868589 RepID=UPI001FE448CD|nr:TRAP transporter small permease subunit [Phreatobacter cathodiphilus]
MAPNPLFLSLLLGSWALVCAAVLWLMMRRAGTDRLMALLLAVDDVSTLIGKAAAWSIVVLTLAICYEVFARYILQAPTMWAFDVSYMLYGVLFMLAGPYALARNGHVRGDFLYREWPPRTQAKLDLVLYFVFFFPGILALCYAGFTFANFSWFIFERSANSPNGPYVFPFKSLIPLVGGLMVVQGLAEVVRCVLCIRTGEWPPRLHDVEETEKIILEQAEAAKTKGAA